VEAAAAVWRHHGVSSVAGAALPPRATAVAMKTPVATAMAGAQTTINNQLKAAAATAMDTGMITPTTTAIEP
jgi:hypothetical protein